MGHLPVILSAECGVSVLAADKPEETEMAELFLREAILMKDFHHVHVLGVIGVSFDSDGSPMVILPYMANGDLRQYITRAQLVRFHGVVSFYHQRSGVETVSVTSVSLNCYSERLPVGVTGNNSRLETCRNSLQHSHSVPLPSVHPQS